ncbi:YhgE/Pip domain-containing protein [Nocardioides marmoriginsengisoli]|uniref:YhgE/Pip domain-containing protein n=1 Tax=Nocardioides marmoriginsengisoli TaxID=661483 RepID=A0A3N0CBF5_9ACTN|nr:YhgE/Pip family protein [Nocardioides marmoriginsengisoli]RNL60649.1 YhgE/Pip domain-containing protein [Nocardioides marmoriginsengisoli]
MTALRMAFTELQRITSGRLRRLSVLALVLVPTLYGGLYLYANHDPYKNLDQVPAALVVLDDGATDPSGNPLNAGREVADQLLDSESFAWHEVGATAAEDGVSEGRYSFALTIPADFSAALTSSARFDPEQARLTMTTNDANSYLSTTIADKVTSNVREALSERVSSEAASQFLLGFGEVRGSLTEAADGAGKIAAGAGKARTGSAQLAKGTTRLRSGAAELATGLGTLRSRTAALPRQTDALADGAAQVAAGNARIAQVGDNLAAFSEAARNSYYDHRAELMNRMAAIGLTQAQQNQILAIYNELERPVVAADGAVQDGAADLRRLSRGANQVSTGARSLANAMPALVTGISDAGAGAARLRTGTNQLASGAKTLDTGLGDLTTGARTLSEKLTAGLADIPDVDADQRERIAATIGDPVAISNVAETKAASYGAGLAPFFMGLAAWIGAYVLFLLVRPLSKRAMAANQAPFRVAFGGWLTPALVGVVQVTALLGVVALAVKIVPENLLGTWLFLILMSATFVAIVHALNAWFGSAGQFLGLVLMVLQLVTAGGTFPWQTIPQPLHGLHHLLPMSYAVDGLRQLMYGGLSTLVVRDALVLLAWLCLAIAASTWAARRQRIWTVQRVKPDLVL